MDSLPLLATKLYIPTPNLSLISRPRLLTILDRGLDGRLLLISAPAGSGKTTLVSEWIAARQLTAAWVSLDAGDNNPVLFWRYVVTALHQIENRIAGTALTALRADQPPRINLLLTGLINEIGRIVTADRARPLILILDDYHAITSREIHEGVIFFLENLPPALHVAVLSRNDPPWSLARMRVRQELVEVRFKDLRFTPKEVTAFLNDAMALALSSAEIDALDRRIEGWAAGLQMAALALRGSVVPAAEPSTATRSAQAAVSRTVAAFGGRHRYILDYLVEEVLEQQPAHVQAFLLQTAVLERFNASLCNAVALRQDSQAILSRLDRANLFLIPLDDARHWYRYHHLFADLLRQRLQESDPTLAPQLHLRASKWYEEQGMIADAVNHALAANDIGQVTRLAEENVLGLLERGELGHIAAWLKALPDDVIHAWPWLCTACAWALAHAGRFEEAMTCLAQLKEIADAHQDEKTVQHVMGHISAVKLYIVAMTFRDWENAARHAHRALALLPDNDFRTRGLVAVLQGFVQRANHQYAAARESIVRALAECKASGEQYAIVDLLCQLARTEEQQGHLHQAAANCLEAIHQADAAWSNHSQSLPVVGYAHATLAAILLEWNQLEPAMHHARMAETLSEQWGHFDSWIESQQLLALILQANGRIAEALTILSNAKRTFGAAATYVARVEAGLYVATGDPHHAVVRAYESGLALSDRIDRLHLAESFFLARVRVARYRHDMGPSLAEVIGHLRFLVTKLTACSATRDTIRALVLQAMALQAVGQHQAAMTTVDQALELAEPEGFVTTFVKEGEPMRVLLQGIAARGNHFSYAGRLLAVSNTAVSTSTASTGNSHSTLPDPLTDRELQVLQLLTSSLTSAEIAEALVVAPSTVRTHIKKIYCKLDVHSRLESVERARTLGILTP